VGSAYTELPGNHHYSAVDDDASLLAVGREAWDDPETARRGGPGGLTLWDITDLGEPQRLATISPPSTPDPTREGVWTHAHNFEFVGEYLYTSWFRGGVRVYDVSEPAEPSEIAAWRASSGGGLFTAGRASFWTARMAVPGSFFVASTWVGSDQSADERLFTFPDPTTHRSTPDSPTNTTASDGRAASAAGTERSPTGTATTEAGTTGSGSPTSPGASPATETNTSGDSASGRTEVDGPGFGIGAAVGALGLVAWRSLRGDGDS
jgi:hypothetical protein